jgi:triacylglycerol esterase/lipase EstA (alpha/beta hydrolase family)
MKKSHLSLLFLAIIASIVAVVFLLNPKMLSNLISKQVTSTNPPIILVHGFNQNSDFWNDIHLISELDQQGTINMGNFQSTKDHEIQLTDPKEITQGQSALYTLSLPENGTKDIRDSAILLEKAIANVIDRHRCEKVRLIAFSAGGIVCREYLSKHPENHRVASLTTVSSPHLGSEHAWLCVNYHNLKSVLAAMQSDESGNFITKNTRVASAYTLEKFAGQMEKWGNDAGIDINSQCALMLAEPENGNYLDQLAKAHYPADIDYHCIITEENILNYNWRKLKTDFDEIKSGNFKDTAIADNLLDLARNGLGKLDKISSDFSSLKFRGDGVVSKHSQDLNNIAAFKTSPLLRANCIYLESDHGNPAIKAAILETLRE